MKKPVQGLLTMIMVLVVGCATDANPPAAERDAAPAREEAIAPQPAPAASPSPTAEQNAGEVASAPANAPSQADLVVIPGERVGRVTRATSRQELADLYGEANLQDEEIPVGEGETEIGTVVNAGSNEAFTVTWEDPSRTTPISVRDFGSAWQTPEGIGVGTSLAKLQETLGDFQLYGFAWDYGGTVVLEGTQLAQYDGLLILRVQPTEEAVETAEKEYTAMAGDRLFSSTDPNLQPLGVTVDEMIVALTAE